MTEYNFIDTSTAEPNETNETTESVENDGPEHGEMSENGLHAYCEECDSWVTAANLHTHAPCYEGEVVPGVPAGGPPGSDPYEGKPAKRKTNLEDYPEIRNRSLTLNPQNAYENETEDGETEDNRGFLGRGFSAVKNILGR